jgi:hypothetical protein
MLQHNKIVVNLVQLTNYAYLFHQGLKNHQRTVSVLTRRMGSLVLIDRIQFYRRRRSAVALFYSISLIVAVLLPYQCVLSEAIDQSEDQGKPNLIMIMTDEHNLRTLQCYRDLMEKDQAYPWGGGVKVKTPYIDSLASNGAIFKNFYTVSPREYNCTTHGYAFSYFLCSSMILTMTYDAVDVHIPHFRKPYQSILGHSLHTVAS